ncbi:TRM11 family SAM-dependent methyltransferase [Longispora albida]|uniref:TRM11 family SAM-dependent methyltransferase n=1 Tax=Longispora albida TaxID=203523 RepID=UPI00035FF521|nr:methyltransferase domain-containing protein [Longispora albida]
MSYRPQADLDQVVRDRLLLRSVPGAVDYLFEDIRHLDVTVLRRRRDSLLIEYTGPLRALAGIRYFSSCAVFLGTEPEPALAASRASGALAALRPQGDLRFRSGEVEDRWELTERLAATPGWANDPGSWDVNLEPDEEGTVAEIGALFLTQRLGELHRMPASTNPLIAAVLVRLAKIEDGQTVLDPFCGAGTLLVTAAEMARPGLLVGTELRQRWAELAEANLAGRDLPGTVLRADAQAVPLAGDSVDRIVANMPFGKRVGSHTANLDLYPAVLREVARLLRHNGRAVLFTDDKRLFKETVQRTPLLRVIKEIMLERGGLHPTAYVITKRGSARASARRAGSRYKMG